VINGVVSDNPVEGLEPRYEWAKMKVAIFNYRKMFGLSYHQVMAEPLEEFVLNAKINELVNTKIDMENKHGR